MKFSNGTLMVSPKKHVLYARAALLLTPTPRMMPDQWAIRNRRYPPLALVSLVGEIRASRRM